MKYSTKLSDAIHILLFIYLNPADDLSSASIAKSIMTNPAYVRQIMSALKKAGFIQTQQGKAAATLIKELDQITMYDMYRAIEGEKPLLHLDTHTNPECGVGIDIQHSIGELYGEIQKTVEEKMKSMTLQLVLETYEERVENLGNFSRLPFHNVISIGTHN